MYRKVSITHIQTTYPGRQLNDCWLGDGFVGVTEFLHCENMRAGRKDWQTEWVCTVGASIFLDFFVLFYQVGAKRKSRHFGGEKRKKTAGLHAVTSLSNATDTRHLHYLQGGDGLAAVYVKNDGGSDSLYFILKDHLGSITGAINNETGKVYRQNFDACSVTPGFGELANPNPLVELIPPEDRRREGRNRNPENWTYTNIPDEFPFLRGYTGHEHLKWFGLINMNGRMYDASLCRFLSPDPYVQMPDNSQNFNRYSYALNNPLIYTDPDGEFIIPALMIGAFVNVVMQGWSGNAQTPGDFALAAGIGALAGAAGAGVGAGVGSLLMGGNFIAGATGACMVNGLGFFGGAAMGGAGAGVSGFISGSGNSWAGGSSFNDGLNDGLQAAGTSAMYGAAFGGVFTGIGAISNQRNFWSGSPQSSGRTLFSFKNGSPIYNTLSYQGGEYRSLERYYFQSNFSQHSSHAKLWDGYSSDRPGTFMKYHNSIAENGNSLNLPSSRIIDLSKFRGASEMTINANLDPGTWVTYNVDGQNVITLKDYPAIYNKVKLNIPAGSNTLTITLHGKSAFSGINRTTINSFIRGWIKAYKLYDNFN